MLSTPKAVAADENATAHIATNDRNLPPQPLRMGGGVAADGGAGEERLYARPSPAAVVITEHEVMLASIASTASHTRTVRSVRTAMLWQRLSLVFGPRRRPSRQYPSHRPSYIERAAMSREMGRL